ncbi:MAG: hypothetical protein WCV69_04350 [Patescibacteria group bacterium]|jgi:hypothetical protein
MKTELKILLALFMMIGILSGCSDDVTNPPLPQVDQFSVDATAVPMVVEVGNYIRFHADGRGGAKPYQGYIWYDVDSNVGEGEDFTRFMSEQGVFTYRVVLTDSLGITAEDYVQVSVVAPNTVEWCVPTNLVVNSSVRQKSELVPINHSGVFHLWGKFRFDTSPRKDVLLWFTYSDGSVRYQTIPDMVLERPAVVLVDLGFWTVEEVQRVTLYLTTDPSKCDGTVSIPELCGSATLPSKSADVDYIMTLNKEGNYTIE